MYEHTEHKSSPRRLLQEVICSLEMRFGSEVENECLRLAQVDALLRRVDLALNADPESKWPTVIVVGRGVVELHPTDSMRSAF